jgi:CPA2 family monovalent cation:H+ antiporter-2
MTGSLAITLLAALGAALLLGAVAHRLGLAPMIGYIAAGLLVGPFTPGFVADREEVLGLADIGVALLMFSLGLRFRLEELAETGRLVLIGAPLQVAFTTGLGAGVALLMGSPLPEALFLGAVVSISSTVVLVKIAGESTLETALHGQLALGWTIVQDLLTVVLVVVLSAIAGESDQPLIDAVISITVALAFVAGVLVVGGRILPALLSRVALLGSRELFVVAIAVLAIGTAAAAGALGVSVALGAFVAGLALAESDLAASVLGEVVPLRELFATIFFVSVGILLQPAALLAGWPIVLVMLLLIVLAKGLPVAALTRLAGHPPGAALRTAGLVAQSGEFSFVLATVGLELGAIAQETFSQAMGAVVLSIVLAAPVAAGASRIGAALERRWPMPDPGADARRRAAQLRRHVVVLGYGQVGRGVARVLEGRGVPWVAVDADYPLVRAAVERGAPLVYGDAGTPSVLDAVRVDTATAVVVAVPDALAARQAVQYAVSRNPRLHVVARAHSEADEADLRRLGAARVITAERELGRELVRHTLSRFGVSEREIDVILRRRE